MIQRLKKAKENKKGFTLVELIVVLVILAILIALLIPALTGYIDKANKRKVETEARNALMACQTLASEAYGDAGEDVTTVTVDTDEAKKLAEVSGEISNVTVGKASDDSVGAGKITGMTYVNSKGYGIVYANGTWGEVSDKGETPVAPSTSTGGNDAEK